MKTLWLLMFCGLYLFGRHWTVDEVFAHIPVTSDLLCLDVNGWAPPRCYTRETFPRCNERAPSDDANPIWYVYYEHEDPECWPGVM